MAAVDPSESPKRQKSPAEEVETSGEQTDAVESGWSFNLKNETRQNKTAESPNGEQRAGVGNDGGGGVASHSEVSVESGAGAEKTTCNSPEDITSEEKMAEAPGSDQRDFDWSETEEDDDEATKTHQEEHDKCDLKNVTETAERMQQDAHVDDDDTTDDADEIHEEETSNPDEKRAERGPAAEPAGEVDGIEEAAGDDKGEDANSTAKPKKCRLVCKECGKRFSRREMFNLHRHFHAHEDELTPLTCKECGLTFQHRSSLIKHRNEHKMKDEQLVTPKKEMHTMEEGYFKCAECERTFSTVDKLRDHNCCNTVEKPYHCPLCRQEFQFKVSITKHMLLHSQESMFKCQDCSQSFPNSMALRFHQRCHAALKPYECPECGLVFKHYSVMEDHRRKHTDNTRSHLCNICGKTFKYSSLLHQHQYLHTGQKPFRCPECGKNFAFAQNMKAHCRQHRLRETNSSTEQPCKPNPAPIQDAIRGPGKENTHQIEEPKRTFNCPLCPQTYSAPANLRAHMLIHEAEYETLERTPKPPKENNKQWEKGHNCPHCPCVYRDEGSLNKHLLSDHKSVAQYLKNIATPPENQFTPINRDNVQGKWKNDGISVKSYKCSECGKTFRHRSVLELHMRIHSKDKPYQCKVCGKGFRFGSYLQQHLIIHTGKKPYKCPDCGKDFAFLQNMRTHQRLHQEKPFRCTSCRKGYSDETQLQHHMLSHNGDKPHKCDLCDKSFGLAYLLRDHMNTHTGERPHRCDECNKTFSWFSSLLVHQKIHARKRQGFSQYNSFPMGARMRGRGVRGRRGGRPMWALPRPLASSGIVASQPYPVASLRDAELHRRAVQPQASLLSPRMDLQGRQQKEAWLAELHPQPVQWKVDGGEVMPVPSPQQQQHAAPQQSQFESQPQPGLQQHHQRSPGWADSPLITQSGPTSAPSSESSHMKESAAAIVSSLTAAVPKKSSPSIVSEMEQPRQPKPVTWCSTPTSTVLASPGSLQLDFSVPTSYMDGAALWSVRPAMQLNSQNSPNKLGQELQLPRWAGAPVSIQKDPSTLPKKEDTRVWDMSNPQVIPSTVSQPEKPWNGCELQKQWVSGLAGVSTSAQIDQSSAMPISTPVSHGVGSTLWDIQAPPGIPKTMNPEKLVNTQDFQLQQKQVSSAWASVSQTATQKVPISIQYEPPRFGQGLGTPVWGFQSNQTLLTGQLKPGNGQELQQQPMVTGTQIIINQPSPFFSPPLAPLPPLALPGPHPLHSVAVGSLSRPPHPNIFFTPQAVMSDRPHITQTLPLPQLAPRTEPHKLGPRLPFAPERLLQCMICGCSLPRELDLQMHYLQHAQGEI
ncbi:zinc finger protein 62 homolog [Centropristis striata]|uniref:zinc finger protein 62 homolog n=1 Tax=Centropristis striata TaxID=184440 RepID=UPI0027E0075E|nr:zinc finger protein 62 homolog [Centropristis striata]